MNKTVLSVAAALLSTTAFAAVPSDPTAPVTAATAGDVVLMAEAHTQSEGEATKIIVESSGEGGQGEGGGSGSSEGNSEGGGSEGSSEGGSSEGSSEGGSSEGS